MCCDSFSGAFCKVVVHENCCAEMLHTKGARLFFLSRDEADGPGLQIRDLRNSQIGALPKSVLLHCAMIEIN